MPGCTAPNCSNSTQKGYKLYHFPADVERSTLWAKNMGRQDGWKPTRHTCICEVHFEETQFESHRADGLKKLKPYAIPTRFSLQNKGRSRSVTKDKNSKQLYTPCATVIGNKETTYSNTSRNKKLKIGRNRTSRFEMKAKKKKKCLDAGNQSRTSMAKGKQRVLGICNLLEENEVCFMCNESAPRNISLNTCTIATKVPFNQKLIKLVSQEFELVVEESSVICITCAQILNFIDYVENILSTLEKGTLYRMRRKFGMKSTEEIDLLAYIKSMSTKLNFPLYKEKDKIIHPKELGNESHDTSKHENVIEVNSEDVTKHNQPENEVKEVSANTIKCQLCTYETQYNALMIYHLRQHLRSLYFCDFCNSSVPDFLDNVGMKVDEGNCEDQQLTPDKSDIVIESIETLPVDKKM